MPVTNETPCDDGLLRTDFDQCVDGVCVGTDLCDTTECAPPAACRQEGVCFRGNCTYELLPQGAQCNDSNSASDGDTCSADGNCVSTVAAPNECQLDATCINGECERHAFVMDGTECTDENPDNVCVHAVCMQGQCVQNVFAGNFSCDDNTPATDFDRCYPDGTCKGVDLCDGVECAPPAACRQEGICFRGTCSYALSPANTTCDDGDALTDFDVCDAEGNCAGVDLCVENDVVCEPLSQCHVPGTCANGECSPSLPKPAGTFCDDGLNTTAVDTCDGNGECVGIDLCTNVTCEALSQCHVVGVCLHATGECTNPFKIDGATCDDGIARTTQDQCLQGNCKVCVGCVLGVCWVAH